MGKLSSYKFRSDWNLDAAPDAVFDALSDLEQYEHWWKEVKEVTPQGDGSYRLRCRSTLPYDLIFTSRLVVEDREGGILESHLEGDLEGFSRWTITSAGAGSRLVFEEEVTTNKRSLNLLAPVARLAFKANHSVMMRHGQAGLKTFVAGFVRGRAMPQKPKPTRAPSRRPRR